MSRIILAFGIKKVFFVPFGSLSLSSLLIKLQGYFFLLSSCQQSACRTVHASMECSTTRDVFCLCFPPAFPLGILFMMMDDDDDHYYYLLPSLWLLLLFNILLLSSFIFSTTVILFSVTGGMGVGAHG